MCLRKDKMKFFTYDMYILDNQIFYSSSPVVNNCLKPQTPSTA